MYRLLLTLLLISTQIVHAQDYIWEPRNVAKKKGDVSTFVSHVEGEDIKAFKGIISLPYSQMAVLEAISDMNAYPYWIYQCKSTNIAIPEDDDVATFYMEFKGFWFVKDRDVIISADLWREGSTIHVVAKNTPMDIVVDEGNVRIPRLDNRWQIKKGKDGWTEVHFQTFINVGGSIPSWIANIIANDAPRKTLQNLGEILNTGAYIAESLDDIEYLSPEMRQNLAKK